VASASSASTSSSQTQTPALANAGSTAQFKSQFDQAIATLANAAGPSLQGTTASTATGQPATPAAALVATLQKKIADLLAKGESVSDIVQQLSASLATSLAAQFGGDTTQIQNQLQTAIASALSPPGTGPPLSTTDLASALAQRFRQVADLAAGVLGETGQSNRLFAGSISDAATTAGVQPAPPTSGNPAPADSIAANASALFASLTATQSDGATVALNGAPAIGSNGDTLLGRMLARATQPAPPVPAALQPQALTPPAQSGPLTGLTASALAAATEALGVTPATSTLGVASDSSAAAVTRVLANAQATVLADSGPSTAPLSTEAAAPLSPAVLAFVKTFTDALASSSAAAGGKTSTLNALDPGTLLQTTVSSAQAPTIGAFAPVQAAVQTDAAATNGAQTPTPLPSQTTVDPNSVVEQLVRGMSLNTVDTTSTVRMRLVPESLGDISVKLTINGSSVDAQIMAQTPAAHDALVAGQAQLTRAFADSGLKLTSFNVDLAGGFASFQQQQQQQSAQQGRSTGQTLLLGAVDTTESNDASLLAAPNFGPPVLAGMNWSALNYLV
jgi:flagellar hook-length control protein FliK